VSVADAHPALDDLAVAIDPTLFDDATIVIVVEDRASEATPFSGKAVATVLVIARTIIPGLVDAEPELDLRLSGIAEGGCRRNGHSDQERP